MASLPLFPESAKYWSLVWDWQCRSNAICAWIIITILPAIVDSVFQPINMLFEIQMKHYVDCIVYIHENCWGCYALIASPCLASSCLWLTPDQEFRMSHLSHMRYDMTRAISNKPYLYVPCTRFFCIDTPDFPPYLSTAAARGVTGECQTWNIKKVKAIYLLIWWNCAWDMFKFWPFLLPVGLEVNIATWQNKPELRWLLL